MNIFDKKSVHPADWEFEFQQRNRNCILMASLHCYGLAHNFVEESRLDIEPYDYIFTNSDKGYVRRKKKSHTLQLLREALTEDAYTSYVLKSAVEKFEEFGKVVEQINNRITPNNPRRELAESWNTFIEAYLKMMPWFYFPWYVSEENMLTNKVREGLEKYKEKIKQITSLNNALLLLIFPTKRALFQKEQELFFDLVKIAERTVNFDRDPVFIQKANQYLKEYDWMPTFYFLPLSRQSLEGLMQTIQDAIHKGALKGFEQVQQKNAIDVDAAAQLFEIIKHDQVLISNITTARELGWALTAGVEHAHKVGSTFKPLLSTIAKDIGFLYEEMQYFRFEEIQQALKGEGISRDELEKRKLGHVYGCINGKVFFQSGNEAIDMSNWFDTEVQGSVAEVTEFRGQSASAGEAQGKVRIALSPKDSHELEEGEILVCSMTSPDYVPAMKRAAAIVTVEGGLLSHAAIMSREFGKPCVVGTKIATQVLKNGDIVNVNADSGIISIIKK